MPEKSLNLLGKIYIYGEIYIGNTQQKFKKIMDGHFSDVQFILKNGTMYSFSSHYKLHFKPNMPCTDLHKYIKFKVVKHINPILAMKNS